MPCPRSVRRSAARAARIRVLRGDATRARVSIVSSLTAALHADSATQLRLGHLDEMTDVCDVSYAEELERIYGKPEGGVLDALTQERTAEWPGFPTTTSKPRILGIGPPADSMSFIFDLLLNAQWHSGISRPRDQPEGARSCLRVRQRQFPNPTRRSGSGPSARQPKVLSIFPGAPPPRGGQDQNAPPHMRGRTPPLAPGGLKNCQSKTQ